MVSQKAALYLAQTISIRRMPKEVSIFVLTLPL